MKLVAFELSSLEDGWLLGDVLLDCVSEVVVDGVGGLEDLLQVLLLLAVDLLQLSLLVGALLHKYLGPQLFEELVGLAEQLLDLALLFLFDDVDIGFDVLLLQDLQPGLLPLFLHFLLLLLPVLEVGLDLVRKLLPVLQLLPVPFHELLPMQLQVLHALLVHHSLSLVVVCAELTGLLVLGGRLTLDQLIPPEK
jgi:hypothetical protein